MRAGSLVDRLAFVSSQAKGKGKVGQAEKFLLLAWFAYETGEAVAVLSRRTPSVKRAPTANIRQP